jgi:acetylglutamate kinase
MDGAGLLNTNADTAAGEIAAALHARTLVFLTDVAGVKDEGGVVRERLTAAEARAMIADGVASGGMIPKLEAACRAALAGCETRIVDGTREGALRAALGGDAGGTAVSAE